MIRELPVATPGGASLVVAANRPVHPEHFRQYEPLPRFADRPLACAARPIGQAAVTLFRFLFLTKPPLLLAKPTRLRHDAPLAVGQAPQGVPNRSFLQEGSAMAAPAKTIRLGNVIGNVFRKEVNGESGRSFFHTVQVSRSYRDGDETKFDNSFTAADLPRVQRVLQLAQGFMETEDVL